MTSQYDYTSGNGVEDETSEIKNRTLKIKLEKAKKSKASLVIVLGKYLGKQFFLESDDVIIGRQSDCGIFVNDKSISRSHAQISIDENDRFSIIDLKSTNGTQVKDKPVKPGEPFSLKDGDLLKLGNIIFKFLAGGNIENLFHAEMLNLAMMDDLTGAYNRKTIMDLLEDEFNIFKMANQPLSIVIFDIDIFKPINDDFGHLAGDFILKETVETVKKIVRQQDSIGRFGGDEFLLLLLNADLPKACEIAERMRKNIEQKKFVYEDKEIQITISLGISSIDHSLCSPDGLFKKADMALYNAKQGGGNVFAVYSEDDRKPSQNIA